MITSATCDNCGTVHPRWNIVSLEQSDDPLKRLEPGGEIPAGTCPDCGCFAYLLMPSAELAAKVLSDGSTVHDVKLPAQTLHCISEEQARRVLAIVRNTTDRLEPGGELLAATLDPDKVAATLRRPIPNGDGWESLALVKREGAVDTYRGSQDGGWQLMRGNSTAELAALDGFTPLQISEVFTR